MRHCTAENLPRATPHASALASRPLSADCDVKPHDERGCHLHRLVALTPEPRKVRLIGRGAAH
eukprot:2544201-Rhodomonas_salina.1